MNFGNKLVIMIGMSRAGTTFMYHNLQKHPQLFLPSRKEIGYFSHHYSRGKQWYENYFSKATSSQFSVDICGLYFSNYLSLDRIKKDYPEAKLILCVRDPYEWIYSLYEQYSGNFYVPEFSEFLEGCNIEREGELIPIDFKNNKISKTIEEYKKLFENNLFIYDFHEFEKKPLNALKKIEEFIGIKNWFNENNFSNKKLNARGRKRSVLFERMLQVKGIVNLILTIFPRSFILFIRQFFEVRNAKADAKPAMKFTDIERNKVKSMFIDDHEYYIELFKDNSFILGDGSEL